MIADNAVTDESWRRDRGEARADDFEDLSDVENEYYS